MPNNIEVQFPKGLLFWAGHRAGGVKKPFVENTGCPIGKIIRTRLLDKIDRWIEEFFQPDITNHRVLLMIGGPGNGKTEAVEYFVKQLDKKMNASGELLENSRDKFAPIPGSLPSRKCTVDLSAIRGAEKVNFKRLAIVHDATVGDIEEPGLSPEELLISELEHVNNDEELLFVAGVNRGILSQTLDEVSSSPDKEQIKKILIRILSAVTLSPKQPSCWPLEGYPHIAVWPMDIESLVDTSAYNEGGTPAHQIFKLALDRSLWLSGKDCLAGKLCPFHANLELLSDDTLLNNLIRILRHYEISSGKRWTFRELFSLIPQLLVGHENDFKLSEREVAPCDWAASLVKTLETSRDSYERMKAKFRLTSKIYTHALFPRWPNLRRVKNKCKQVLKKDVSNDANANDLFRMLGWFRNYERTSIQKLIREQVGILLDPVELSGKAILAGNDICADTIEEMFNYSVNQGYSKIREFLSEPERLLIDWIVQVEERIGKDASEGNKNLAGLYDEVRKIIRLFSCRLVKRNLAVKKGITKENSYLEQYVKIIGDDLALRNVKKKFSELIHVDSRFPVSLATTYGHSMSHSGLDAIMSTHMVKVKCTIPTKSENLPRNSLPYLKINDHSIPLTFPLFKTLIELKENLMKASIPTEILALIDGTRARMAGEITRDIEGLDDATIKVGETELSLTIRENKIQIER